MMSQRLLRLGLELVCRGTFIFFALLGRTAVGEEPTVQASERWDIAVFAPHSDDEAIGCTGVLLRAIEQKQRVGVVVVTAGDGFPKAAAAAAKKSVGELQPADYIQLAALRQRHTVQAMTQLGVPATDILFLGYPDGGLKTIYESAGAAPYRQPLTGKSETYGVSVGDYHSQRHGSAAPYTKRAMIDDLAEILRTRRPRTIYTTHEVDTHPDHRTTFHLVRDAATAAGFAGELLTYIVHGKPLQETPRRIVLNEAEKRRKRATIETYQVGVSPVHDDLAETYALPEELFWPVRVTAR